MPPWRQAALSKAGRASDASAIATLTRSLCTLDKEQPVLVADEDGCHAGDWRRAAAPQPLPHPFLGVVQCLSCSGVIASNSGEPREHA